MKIIAKGKLCSVCDSDKDVFMSKLYGNYICKKHYIVEIPYLRTIHLGDSVYEEKKIQ